ncbi:drug/metabolite transporter (DMT)-like permease [Microvirga lupini]|uniref:Drug/metabolite transporter (DMT)-like permease n=1 Tax=Microvirga lupini TaxID=420324 RepID=A0A7W4VQK2_9HYPH|nr:DMT family transporter [Microvirga lupini]MBB3021490.1 drug/metabolite transporter (DMT)-like permease [Microvirga lupini]
MADSISTSQTKPVLQRQNRMIGIALMCTALFCFSCLDATAKWVNQSVDPMVTVWARYMSAAVLTFMVINPRTQPGALRTRRLPLQLLRSFLLLASTFCNFLALKYLQLVETQSIIFATPLLVALLAAPMLGERIGWQRLTAIAVGFVGILVITRPGLGTMHPAALLSLAGSVAYAFYNIVTKMLASSDSVATTTLYSSVAGIVFLTPVLPWVWSTPSSPLVWFLLASTGFYGGFGHWLLVLAHARAPAAILAPFIYSQIIWMLALGYIVFGDWPDSWTFVGAGIVIASGLYLLSRERTKRTQPETSS